MKYTSAVLQKNWLLKKIPWTNQWEVWESFVWFLDYESKKTFVEIPKGFLTDFGSIPFFMRIFMNPTKYLAYILHDFLYSRKWKIKTYNWWFCFYLRKGADDILIEAMNVEWAWFLEKLVVYVWVRLFGFLYFKKK